MPSYSGMAPATGGIAVPSGRYFPSGNADDVRQRSAAEVFPRLDGWLVVLAHRDPAADVVAVAGEPVGFGEFASRVAAANPDRLPVVLMVCGAGLSSSGAGLAEVMRSVSGVPVLATPGMVWQTACGVRTERWARPGHGPAGAPAWWHYAAAGGAALPVGADLAAAVRTVTPGVDVRGLSGMPLPQAVAWIGPKTLAEFWMTPEQFGGLIGQDLRIDDTPADSADDGPQQPEGDGFFTALLRQASEHVRMAVTTSDTPSARSMKGAQVRKLHSMNPAQVRMLMADEFPARYDALPARYDPAMVDADGARVEVRQIVELLASSTPSHAGVLRTVLPLLAADLFGVWVSTVTPDARVLTVGPPADAQAATEVTVLSVLHPPGQFLPLTQGRQTRPEHFVQLPPPSAKRGERSGEPDIAGPFASFPRADAPTYAVVRVRAGVPVEVAVWEWLARSADPNLGVIPVGTQRPEALLPNHVLVEFPATLARDTSGAVGPALAGQGDGGVGHRGPGCRRCRRGGTVDHRVRGRCDRRAGRGRPGRSAAGGGGPPC